MQIAGIPAARFHVDPAFDLEIALHILASRHRECFYQRSILFPTLDADSVLARRERQSKGGGNIEMFVSLFVVELESRGQYKLSLTSQLNAGSQWTAGLFVCNGTGQPSCQIRLPVNC